MTTPRTPMERAKHPGVSPWRAWAGSTLQMRADTTRHQRVVPMHSRPVR
ncbi:MAG TPA: hypothetical protein VD865_08965 [Stenotrophomonas sp.]|nr:hypothetical protein [Stenotrophomonas sp.]